MKPRQFWRTTPKKFGALCELHVELNSTQKDKSSRRTSVGRQETYVDNLNFM
nr:MAG TPA: tail assembly chaperone protein [Caudoviricetes sp.]